MISEKWKYRTSECYHLTNINFIKTEILEIGGSLEEGLDKWDLWVP